MYLVHNERTKLRATLLNTVGIAMIVIGALTPVAAALYGSAEFARSLPSYFLIVGPIGWILFGLGLHFVADRILGRLQE